MGHQRSEAEEKARELQNKAITEKCGYIEDEKSSKKSKDLIDHEEHRSTPDINRVNRLLKDFKPEELGDRLTGREAITMFFLKAKAVIPMLVALFMIYFIGGVYIFTYLLPLVSDDYNSWSYFFYEDEDRIPGLRKLPKSLRYLHMSVIMIMYGVIQIAFYRAALTSPGNLPKDEEWTLREDTLDMFRFRNQVSDDILDIDIDKVNI